MNFFDRFKNPVVQQNSVQEPALKPIEETVAKVEEQTFGDKVEEFFEPVTEKIDEFFNGSDEDKVVEENTLDVENSGFPSLTDHNVEVYTLSYCGWCKKAKSVLDSFDVKYTEYQLDDASTEAANIACQSDVFRNVEKMLTDSGTTLDHSLETEIFMEIYSNPDLFNDENIEIKSSESEANSEKNELIALITENIEAHEEVLPALEYFMEAEAKCELEFSEAQAAHQKLTDDFTKFTEDNHTGNFVPQIIVDGKYFGGFQEISECPKHYSDLESCFDAFHDRVVAPVALTL